MFQLMVNRWGVREAYERLAEMLSVVERLAKPPEQTSEGREFREFLIRAYAELISIGDINGKDKRPDLGLLAADRLLELIDDPNSYEWQAYKKLRDKFAAQIGGGGS
jgi:hypothetical protein